MMTPPWPEGWGSFYICKGNGGPPTRAKPAGFGEAETACGLYPAPCREYKGAPVAQTGALVYLYGWG